MKIKKIRVYQHVYLDGKITSYFADDHLSLELIEGVGVRVESDTDAIIVTFNNISMMQLDKSSLKRAAASKAK